MLYQNNESFLITVVLLAVFMIACLLVIVARYIIVSKRNEQNLIAAKRLNDAIMESTKYIIIATDPQGKILFINKQTEVMMGYYQAEILNRIIPRRWLLTEQFLDRYEELKREFPTMGMDFDVFSKRPTRDGMEISEWTFVRKNGEQFPVKLTITPIKDEHKRISGFLGVAEDLSEWNSQRDALKESEETFRIAMENASIGKALVRPDGKWLRANRALCALLGYTEDELKQMDFQKITHPDDLETDVGLLKKTLAGEISTYQIEKRYFHKNGTIIWALLSVSLIRNLDQSPKFLVSQIQDITDKKNMEQRKNEFISLVSHELRTPLTSIRGSLGLIEGVFAAELPEKVLHLITLANRNSERLILLINDILDLDKISAGEMSFDISPQPLADIVRQSVDTNRSYAETYGVIYRIEPGPENVIVDVDTSRLMQVLANLLSNAAKFSPKGEVVTISLQVANGNAIVKVADKGPGIPVEFRPRIFDKFSQADASVTREKGGTGLGLHISKMLIQRMNGEIGFMSEVGEGTTFWIKLPLQEQA